MKIVSGGFSGPISQVGLSILFIYFVRLWRTSCGNELNVVTDRPSPTIDPNGYITFCPCMGRFGNQADHYLGVLGFAQGLNRTLILPPWVEYRTGALKSIQIPFETYFKIKPLERYHRVISMEEFMKKLAPKIWTPENRTVFCYTARHNSDGCSAKEGNPFGPFWDTYNIDFVASELYSPLTYDIHHQHMAKKWKEKYPASKWPVLAFAGAPASFPVQFENLLLQKFFEWNDDIMSRARKEISKLSRGPFIAVHLRNGIDWERACKHIDQTPNLFAAPQCLGYRGENGAATMDLCFPSKETIVKQLKRTLKKAHAKSLFVSSDNDHMISHLSQALSKMKIDVHKMEEPEPHVELAIMGMANYFIGNCVSSFSAFVKRERDVKGFPSSFWAFPLLLKKIKYRHNEL